MGDYRPIWATEVPAGIRFDVLSRDQGQTIEYAYGTFGRAEAGDEEEYMRATDRSREDPSRAVTYYRRIDAFDDHSSAVAPEGTTVLVDGQVRRVRGCRRHGGEEPWAYDLAGDTCIERQRDGSWSLKTGPLTWQNAEVDVSPAGLVEQS